MDDLPIRLGDLIDDYCPRCRLLLNHAVASMVENKVAKVICQTCLTEHPYLHSDGSKRKKPAGTGRETLFDQVLAHSGPAAAAPPLSKKKKGDPSTRYIRRNEAKAVPKSRG